MAVGLSQTVIQRNGSRLLPCAIAVARVYSRGVGSASFATSAHSASQDKPLTVEDLPRVSFLEMVYRLVFQGFYSRMHELQVPQTAVLLCMVSG